jgi:hypothetical protein
MNKYKLAMNLLTANGTKLVDQSYASLFVVASMLNDAYVGGAAYKLPANASIQDELRAAIAARDPHAAKVLLPTDFGGAWGLSS